MKKIFLSAMAVLMGLSAYALTPTAKMAINLVSANNAKDYVTLVEEPTYSSAKEEYESNKIVKTDDASTVNVYALQDGSGWDDPKAAIVMTNDLVGTPIVIVTNTTETSYKFTFSNVDGRTLKLWDKYLNVYTDITGTAEYAFTVASAGRQTIADRFEIAEEELLVYTRSLNANQVFGTICYPYKAEKIMSGKMYKMNYFDGTQLILELEDNPAGGMPYVFKADNAESVKWYYKDENRVDDIASVPGFVGTYEEISTPVDNMYLVSNNKVQNYAAGSTVGEYRAYIVLEDVPTEDQFSSSAPERRLAFTVKKITTADEQVAVKGVKDGVYMVNGQLVIVKDGEQFMVNGYNK